MSAWVVAAIAAAIAIADRATKVAVVETLARGETVPVIPGFFSLVHVRNPGAAFGILSSGTTPWREMFLISVSLAAVAGLVWLLRATPPARRWERGAVAAVIGGAVGNLYDRLAFGEVIDFLDVYVGHWHWPAFNVADSAITVGMCILVATALFTRPADPEPSETAADGSSVPTD